MILKSEICQPDQRAKLNTLWRSLGWAGQVTGVHLITEMINNSI